MLIRLGFMSSSFVSFEKNHTVHTDSQTNRQNIREKERETDERMIKQIDRQT